MNNLQHGPNGPYESDGIFKIIDIIQDFYANGIDEHLMVFALLVLIVFDIVLGASRAWAQKVFSSSKLRKGVVSHVSIFSIVALAYPFAVHTGTVVYINSFITAMIISFGASILKNLSVLGVKLPYLEQLIARNVDHDKEFFQLGEDESIFNHEQTKPSKLAEQVADKLKGDTKK